jgi:hypothetical protein
MEPPESGLLPLNHKTEESMEMETESLKDVRRLTDGYEWSDEEDIALAAFLEFYRATPRIAWEGR